MISVQNEGVNMLAVEKRRICTNPECRAEIIVEKNPAADTQNLRCACGSDLKKLYHRPVLKVYGRLADLSRHFPNRG